MGEACRRCRRPMLLRGRPQRDRQPLAKNTATLQAACSRLLAETMLAEDRRGERGLGPCRRPITERTGAPQGRGQPGDGAQAARTTKRHRVTEDRTTPAEPRRERPASRHEHVHRQVRLDTRLPVSSTPTVSASHRATVRATRDRDIDTASSAAHGAYVTGSLLAELLRPRRAPGSTTPFSEHRQGLRRAETIESDAPATGGDRSAQPGRLPRRRERAARASRTTSRPCRSSRRCPTRCWSGARSTTTSAPRFGPAHDRLRRPGRPPSTPSTCRLVTEENSTPRSISRANIRAVGMIGAALHLGSAGCSRRSTRARRTGATACYRSATVPAGSTTPMSGRPRPARPRRPADPVPTDQRARRLPAAVLLGGLGARPRPVPQRVPGRAQRRPRRRRSPRTPRSARPPATCSGTPRCTAGPTPSSPPNGSATTSGSAWRSSSTRRCRRRTA